MSCVVATCCHCRMLCRTVSCCRSYIMHLQFISAAQCLNPNQQHNALTMTMIWSLQCTGVFRPNTRGWLFYLQWNVFNAMVQLKTPERSWPAHYGWRTCSNSASKACKASHRFTTTARSDDSDDSISHIFIIQSRIASVLILACLLILAFLFTPVKFLTCM